MLYEVTLELKGTDLRHFYVVEAENEKSAYKEARARFTEWCSGHMRKAIVRPAKIHPSRFDPEPEPQLEGHIDFSNAQEWADLARDLGDWPLLQADYGRRYFHPPLSTYPYQQPWNPDILAPKPEPQLMDRLDFSTSPPTYEWDAVYEKEGEVSGDGYHRLQEWGEPPEAPQEQFEAPDSGEKAYSLKVGPNGYVHLNNGNMMYISNVDELPILLRKLGKIK